MTGFWIALAAMTVATLLAVSLPLVRRRGTARDAADYDLAVYKDQLDEVEREKAEGMLDDAQAEAARVEIKRRMLVAAESAGRASGLSPRGRLTVIGVMFVLLPLGTLALYLELGRPDLQDRPFLPRKAESLGVTERQVADLMRDADRLAQRLSDNPGNPEVWAELGDVNAALRRHGEAVEAYRQAITQGSRDPRHFVAFGTALVAREDGRMTDPALRAFNAAAQADPALPQPRYFLGLARMQAGEPENAIAIWRDLEQASPPGAPWLAMLRARIAAAAQQAGVDPRTVAPRPAHALPPVDLAAVPQTPAPSGPMQAPSGPMQAQSPEEQQAMIGQMVTQLAARLEDNPDDLEGWMRLGRSYGVLGELDLSRDAYGKAAELAPDDPGIQMAYAESWLRLVRERGDATIPDGLAEQFAKVIDLQPDNPMALFYLATARATQGEAEVARDLLVRLAENLPKDSPEFAEVQKRIESLN